MAQFLNVRKEKFYNVRNKCQNEDFRKLYRFNRKNVEWLANYFLKDTGEKRGGALPPVDKMKIFLRVVSDPGFQNGVAEELCIHQTTVSKTFTLVMNQILNKAHIWIRFPRTSTEIVEAKNLWTQMYTFPNAIGVIDCTHVRIPKWNGFGDEYVNRKGFTSVTFSNETLPFLQEFHK